MNWVTDLRTGELLFALETSLWMLGTRGILRSSHPPLVCHISVHQDSLAGGWTTSTKHLQGQATQAVTQGLAFFKCTFPSQHLSQFEITDLCNYLIKVCLPTRP